MTDKLEPCKCGGEPDLVDDCVGWYVKCQDCGIRVHGERHPEIDHSEGDTDEEIDAANEALCASIDWAAVRQTAIDAWNRRSGGAR